MEQNKVRTYLLYAVGEILLVVFGILIAIQINTALDDQRNQAKHDRMVRELSTEFENNLAQLDTVITYQRMVYDSGLKLMEVISNGGEGTTHEEFREMLFKNRHRWTFDPLNGVLESSISSGNIHLLKNDSLKTLLFSWDSIVLDAREEQVRANIDYDRINSYLEKHIMKADVLLHDQSQYKLPGSHFQSNYKTIVNDSVYENLIVNRWIYTTDVLLELEPLRELNTQVLEFLEMELE